MRPTPITAFSLKAKHTDTETDRGKITAFYQWEDPQTGLQPWPRAYLSPSSFCSVCHVSVARTLGQHWTSMSYFLPVLGRDPLASMKLIFFLSSSDLHGITLTSSPNQAKCPGDSVRISCQVSGYALTSIGTGWIRHPPGKAMQWIGIMWGGGSFSSADPYKSRFTISRDSSNVLYLDISSLQTEDSAVYYCARTATVQRLSGRPVQKHQMETLTLTLWAAQRQEHSVI